MNYSSTKPLEKKVTNMQMLIYFNELTQKNQQHLVLYQ